MQPKVQADSGSSRQSVGHKAVCRQETLAPAANFLACSTPLAARLQKTSESFACSLGLLTATSDNALAEGLCLLLQTTGSTLISSQLNITSDASQFEYQSS